MVTAACSASGTGEREDTSSTKALSRTERQILQVLCDPRTGRSTDVHAMPPLWAISEGNIAGVRDDFYTFEQDGPGEVLGTVPSGCDGVSLIGRHPPFSAAGAWSPPWFLVRVAGPPEVRGWAGLDCGARDLNAGVCGFFAFGVNPVTGEANLSERQFRRIEDEFKALPLAEDGSPVPGELPDLAFTTPHQVEEAGDPCNVLPGLGVGVGFELSLRNIGRAPAPSPIRVEYYYGIRTIEMSRPLQPGEVLGLHKVPEKTVVTLDPHDTIEELDESDNRIRLPDVPDLVCGG